MKVAANSWNAWLRSARAQPTVAEHVVIHDLILALVVTSGSPAQRTSKHARSRMSSLAAWPDAPHAHHEFVETDCELTSSLAILKEWCVLRSDIG